MVWIDRFHSFFFSSSFALGLFRSHFFSKIKSRRQCTKRTLTKTINGANENNLKRKLHYFWHQFEYFTKSLNYFGCYFLLLCFLASFFVSFFLQLILWHTIKSQFYLLSGKNVKTKTESENENLKQASSLSWIKKKRYHR